MKLRQMLDDTAGSAMVEYAFTLSAFILLTFGIVQVGLLMWTQAGLQHGVELAARCASVNTTLCGTATQIQNFAAANSLAVSVPASDFTVTQGTTCGVNNGNRVTASYTFSFRPVAPNVTVTAQSCYPS
jgi:Flp pilus assembly protein TadG